MPRISEARKAAQRAKIVGALLESVSEKGIADTSMADVIERSGLSAGAIYGYFQSKDDILVTAAREVVRDRAEVFSQFADRDPVPPPVQAVREVAGSLPEVALNAPAMIQVWGQAMTHPVLNSWSKNIIDRLLEAGEVYLRAWFTQCGHADPGSAARRAAPALLALVQGYILQTALRREVDLDEYAEGLNTLFGEAG